MSIYEGREILVSVGASELFTGFSLKCSNIPRRERGAKLLHMRYRRHQERDKELGTNPGEQPMQFTTVM